MVTCARLLIAFLLLINVSAGYAAEVEAWLDRNPISANQSVTLTIEVQGDISGMADFEPLREDFDIISRRAGTQVQFINGKVSRTRTWNLTLRPKRQGILTIPALAIGTDLSPELELEVAEGKIANDPNEDLFIEVEVEPKNPYVQQQIIYTVRLNHAIKLGNASLSQPQFENGEALIKRLGEDRSYTATINDRDFQVIERRYAIYPQKSGKLRIAPLIFDGQIVEKRQTIWDPFGGSSHSERLLSEAVDMDIRPIPEAFTGKHWLPAHNLQLAQSWSDTPPSFKAGEPTTHTLAIIAEGLTAAQLPELNHGQLKGSKQYPDQAQLRNQSTDSGITGIRQQKIALIPQQGGALSLPEIELPWWNLASDEIEIARLPAQDFPVEGAVPPPVVRQPVIVAPTPKPEPKIIVPTTKDSAFPLAQWITPLWWPWIASGLLLLWLLTLMLWTGLARRNRTPKTTPVCTPKADISAIRKACKDSNASNTKQALLDWTKASCTRVNVEPTTHLNGLAQAAKCAGADELAKALIELNRCLYSGGSEHWDGKVLAQQLPSLNRLFTESCNDDVEQLEPMYKS